MYKTTYDGPSIRKRDVLLRSTADVRNIFTSARG